MALEWHNLLSFPEYADKNLTESLQKGRTFCEILFTMVANTTTNSIKTYNWASVQLNLIMLPVGLSLLLIVSLSACICHWLRKRRLKVMARKRRHQQRTGKVNGNTERVTSFAYFETSPTRTTQVTAKDRSLSPTHPATLRKEKIRKKKKKLTHSVIIENGHKVEDLSTKGNASNTGIRMNSGGMKTRNGRIAPERRASGIPVLIRPNTKGKRRTSVRSGSSSPINRLADERRPHTVDTSKPYTIDMDTVKTPAKDRRKWVVPDTPRVEYDHKGSLRLPPLSELRTANTA